MQEEVEVQGKAGPGGRLDMNHGFVHHIRRNQIARDDYDREVKQAKEKQKKRYTPGPARPKKPDLQVYHPRQRATEKVHTAGALKDEPNDNGTQLFCLDFEADGGEVTSVIVYEVSVFLVSCICQYVCVFVRPVIQHYCTEYVQFFLKKSCANNPREYVHHGLYAHMYREHTRKDVAYKMTLTCFSWLLLGRHQKLGPRTSYLYEAPINTSVQHQNFVQTLSVCSINS
ncbi:hypothetical protein XENTR_v10009540 [Xenopus tropicalis]|uniref:Chromosome 2 open reading frame 68 n=1 Tax=Xenopus tropicalis TaxID=8364 RepID=F6PUF2_XENTR|nr:hypothetical protein XENTR_v10009540 [Xenopus tropicalis]